LSVFVVVAFALVIGQVVYVFLFFAYNFCWGADSLCQFSCPFGWQAQQIFK